MQIAEQVTFGGSGFDRAAHIRTDDGKLKKLLADGNSRAIAFWRGKPLVDQNAGALVWLPLDHEVFNDATEAPVFLGLKDGHACFAFDIPKWEAKGQDHPKGFWDESRQTHPTLLDGQFFADLRSVMVRLSAEDGELAAMSAGVFAWHVTHGYCARCGEKTEISMAGWQRCCPACDGRHFPRTDPVVIMLVTHGNKVLVGRSPHWPEGMLSLLAGFMEPGETLEAAVRREVFEESAIRVGRVSYLASQPWPFPSSLMIGCSAEALTTEITIDPTEIELAKWVSREEILTSWAEKSGERLAARKGSIANFLIRNWLSDRLS